VLLFWGTQRGRKSWNGPGGLTHFDEKCLRGKDKHTAEKPLDLGLRLVDYFSNLNETILDPFMGSGTFGLAAAIRSRDYVGVELDPVWFEKAKARISLSDSALSPRDQERLQRALARASKENEDYGRTDL
jgi:site-specific DNA-methyltransferase (adenine-specific)